LHLIKPSSLSKATRESMNHVSQMRGEMPRNSNDFSETYSQMSDDELLRIKADVVSLVEEAKQALEREIEKRQITISNDPLEAECQTEATTETPEKGKSSWWVRWGTVIFVWAGFQGGMNSTAAQSIAEVKARFILYFIFTVWGITQFIAGRTIKRTLIIAIVYLCIGGAWFGIMQYRSRDRDERIHQLLIQARTSLGPANEDFRRKMGQIMERDPQTFADFETRNDSLESLLDTNDVTMNKSRQILGQLQEEFSDSTNVQSMITTLEQVLDNDSKTFGYLREEITCSRVLARSTKVEQSNFRERCIAPGQEKMAPLLLNEEILLRELQSKGATLPPDVAKFLR